jgi:hypothetical protein
MLEELHATLCGESKFAFSCKVINCTLEAKVVDERRVGLPEGFKPQRVFRKEGAPSRLGPEFSAVIVVPCQCVEEVGLGLLAD